MISMEPVLKRGYATWDRALLPDDEYALRVDAVRRRLRAAGLDALLVVNHSLLGVMVDYADIAYLTGLQSGGLLLVPLDGDPAFVSFGGGRELAFLRTQTWLPNVLAGAGKPFDVVRGELEARGIARGALGVVGTGDLAAGPAERLATALAAYERRAFDPQLRALRAAKRPREILALRVARSVVAAAVAAGVAAFAAGGDNRAAMLEAERVARARKARDVRVLASMGGPELRPWEGRLAGRHAPLRLWVAAQYQGYWAEEAATSPAASRDAARRAVQAMTAAVRSGVAAGAVASAALETLSAGAAEGALAYGLGGTIGLAHREGVDLRPGNDAPLVEGSVLALRVHVPEGGDASLAGATVVVGARGAEPLAPLSRE